MEENKNFSVGEGQMKTVPTQKNWVKSFAVILGIIIIVLLAAFSVLGILGKNRMVSKKIGMDSVGMQGNNGFGLRAPMIEKKDTGFTSDIAPYGSGAEVIPYENPENVATDNSSSLEIQTDKKIIKNGDLSLKVTAIDKAQEKISEIAKSNAGDIFSSNIFENSSRLKSGTIIIKVPVKNFEKAISEIKKVASLVVREATTGQDVGAEYQDLEIRIRNKQAEEQSYVKILERAEKISDVIAVTRQLATVRGEIERLQGQMRFMNSETELSTINISLSEDQNITVSDSWRPFQVAKDAVNHLVKSVQGFVNFLIVFVIIFIPVALLYCLVIYIVYLIIRKIYRKFKKSKESV